MNFVTNCDQDTFHRFGYGSCVGCETSNPTQHRFCRRCGNTLWKQCPQCNAERPVDETFFPPRRQDVRGRGQMIESSQQRLKEIRAMVDRLELDR